MDTELDLGAMGFWLFLGAVVASYIIGEAMKQKSLHRLIETSIEKTGAIDAKLVELLDLEIQRKAVGEGFAWERSAGAGRKVLSVIVGFLGLPFGFFALALAVRLFTGAAPKAEPGGVLAGLGVAAGVVGLFILFAWLIWPKSEKSSASEPRV